MIKFIILNFGYVENSHPYSWIYEHRIGFKTKFEAALSLAKDYYEAYLEKYPQDKLKECCIKAKKDKDNYCKKCGHYLGLEESFSESYKNWLINISEKDMDGSEVVNYFDMMSNWCSLNPPYGITKKNSLYISSAEKILTGLLYKTGLESHVDEDIEQEILGNTDFDRFKASFEKDDGPDIYGN
jgi:hypothetical protein